MINSKTFEEWTAGVFNLGKLLALAALGFWTLYQWNVSIFPKESFDEFARRAARRTDLTVSLEKVEFEWIRGEIVRTLILSGQSRFRNEKDFPISLSIEALKFREGTPARADFTHDTGKSPSQPVMWTWLKDETVPLERAFGAILADQPFVIEPKGELTLPLYLVLWLQWSPNERYRFVELDIEATAQAVHPGTGQTIEKSRKKKRVTLRAVIPKDGGRVVHTSGGLVRD